MTDWKKLFELKQDDWIKVCKEVDCLETEIVSLRNRLLESEARRVEMRGALELALSFCPKGPVPKGLDPTFYHTLSYSEEVELQSRIDAARKALAADSTTPNALMGVLREVEEALEGAYRFLPPRADNPTWDGRDIYLICEDALASLRRVIGEGEK